MSTRPVEPRGEAGGPLAPFIVLGVAWAAIALVWLAWLAGRLAALVSGHPWRTGPPFGGAFVTDLIHAHWHTLWPGVAAWLVAVVYAVLLLAALAVTVGGWALWQAHRPHADDPLPSLADRRDVATLTLPEVAVKARRLRAGLADTSAKAIAANQAGVVLGTHRRRGLGAGERLYASWEDVLLAVMAPRAGKTTALTAPGVIDAPGAVIATSNKPDLWATTYAHRATKGRIWLFDPQSITYQPQDWWWNPLAAIRSYEDAFRLADHFVQQIRTAGKTGEDFWIMAAHELITALILAAACKDGSLIDVQTWLSDVTSREPATVLEDNGFHAASRSIRGLQAGFPETRDGVYQTARTAATCLSDPQIMTWVTKPDRRIDRLDVTAFPTSRDTLYLLSKDGAGAAAPLVAGLTDQVLREAVRTAEIQGGRLDPVLLAVLDEAANICKISDLPQLYSHFGSRGIVPMTILQSYPQGTAVWGQHGMDALWSASTIKLVGAGIDDARFAEDMSRLIGEHDIPVASRTRDGSGHTSWQTSVRRQRILDGAQIRALPKGTALLLATGIRVAMIDLLPWYEGPIAEQLSAAATQAADAIAREANAAYTRPGRPGAGPRPQAGGRW